MDPGVLRAHGASLRDAGVLPASSVRSPSAPTTLEAIAQQYRISRERVRQVTVENVTSDDAREARFEKVRRKVPWATVLTALEKGRTENQIAAGAVISIHQLRTAHRANLNAWHAERKAEEDAALRTELTLYAELRAEGWTWAEPEGLG